jgi:hypothetical protein
MILRDHARTGRRDKALVEVFTAEMAESPRRESAGGTAEEAAC